MREILFKAKRKNWRELLKENWWVEGNLITDEIDADIVYIGYVMGSENGVIHDIDVAQIDPETLCQYTGLTDKNGNKIWENDILRTCDRGTLRVSWNTFKASWVLSKKGWLFNHFFGEAVDPEDVEVVENYFDNPELLEQDGG